MRLKAIAFVACFLLTGSWGCSADPVDWEVAYLEGRVDSSQPVPIFGVGVTTRLGVGLQRWELNVVTGPKDLRVLADDESAVEISLGPAYALTDGTLKTYRELRVKPIRAGPNRLRLIADDSDEMSELVYKAMAPVTFSHYLLSDGRTEAAPSGSVSVFPQGSLRLRAVYTLGDAPVLGGQIFTREDSASGAELENNTLDLGSVRETVTLSAVPGLPLIVRAVSAQDVHSVDISQGSALSYDGAILKVKAGLNVFFNIRALDAQGAPIFGTGGPRFSFETPGPILEPFAVGSGAVGDFAFKAVAVGEQRLYVLQEGVVRKSILVRSVPQ